MNKVAAILGMMLSLSACALLESRIDGDKINFDEATNTYTFKDTGQPVTGKVAFRAVEGKTGKRYTAALREIRNGKRVNIGRNYYPRGSMSAEYPYDSNGLISGVVKEYYENGMLSATVEYRDNKRNGKQKEFAEGVQISEIVFENDINVREYSFDGKGKKLIPAIEMIDPAATETGFLAFVDYVSKQTLFQPVAVIKWTNKSDRPIQETVEVEGVFVDNARDMEIARVSDYLHHSSEAPLQPNMSGQTVLRSRVVFVNPYAISKANISCQIIVNRQLLKVFRIKNAVITNAAIR